jgi:hypothetical protein
MRMVRALALGAAASGAVALGVRATMSGYRTVSPGCRVLTAKEQAIVAACADAFFPPHGPIAISGTEAGLVEYMDDYVRRLPVGQGRLVRLLFHFIEHGPWVFGPRPVRFTKMSQDERLRVLDLMRRSPIYFRRVSFVSMRAMLSMGYLAHPVVIDAMGMTPDADPFGLGDPPEEVLA